MALQSKDSLHRKLADKRFRKTFISSRIAQTLGMQVRVMRQRLDLSQKDLARALGTSQNAIYRLESPKAIRPNISTLERIAEYFDVGLVVRFAPFSEIADWTLNLAPECIDVPSFDADLGFVDRKPPATDDAGSGSTAMSANINEGSTSHTRTGNNCALSCGHLVQTYGKVDPLHLYLCTECRDAGKKQ
jgi:transcriptional regulator with XRE-family HTH domain